MLCTRACCINMLKGSVALLKDYLSADPATPAPNFKAMPQLGHVDKWQSQRRIDVISMKPR